ncbi:MAG: FkbM family methyltransferase [Sporichthyaceae bacterium]
MSEWLKAAVPVTGRSIVKILRAEGARRLGSERFSWPALHNLDRTMRARLPRTGVFLEIGANDGYSYSNTYYLEKHDGWRGILIEPLPSMFKLCRAHRRNSFCFNMACVGPYGPLEITLLDKGLMAVSLELIDKQNDARRLEHGGRQIRVPTATMSDLIDRSGLGCPDFISVDVEGAELQVLEGLDLARHCPRFLLVETYSPAAVNDLLYGRMKEVDRLSHHDYLFERIS